MNNVMQRVASSVAVAVFGSLNATAAAQLMADRGSLLSTGANALPQITEATQHGPAGLVGIYQQLNMNVTTQTYDNGFYIVALMSAGGALLALLLRSGKAKAAGGPVHVEV